MNSNTVPRLFPISSSEPLLTECQIRQLATLLVRPTVSRSSLEMLSHLTNSNNLIEPELEFLPNFKIIAGLTYVGQIISHDIVPRTRPRPDDRALSTSLNLDSVYGNINGRTDFSLFDSNGLFLHSGEDFDVHRINGKAAIPDQRNDENAIIVQLHRQIQKLHNRIIRKLDYLPPGINKINQTREIVMTLFHMAIVNELLVQILDEDVYKQYFKKTKPFIRSLEEPMSAIPIEFTHAAFRFGHSIILNRYRLAKGLEKNISELLRGPDAGPVDSEFKIEWREFFGDDAQTANKIDMLIEAGMTDIPLDGNIVFRNLKAGEALKLPSGFAIKGFIQAHPSNLGSAIKLSMQEHLKEGSEGHLIEAYELLEDHFKLGKLPLWLYILRESYYSHNRLYALGKTGSVIVAEVLRSSIINCYSANSFREGQQFNTSLESLPHISTFFEKTGAQPPDKFNDLLTLFNEQENNDE